MELIKIPHFSAVKTFDDCVRVQEEIAKSLRLTDAVPIEKIRYIAGVDCAYFKDGQNTEFSACCIAVTDVNSGEVVATSGAVERVNFPYIHGCLAFRELPAVLEAVKKLDFTPHAFMFDGNGVLHPRKAGLAAHASSFIGVPCFGVAKTYFRVHGADYVMPAPQRGAFTDITVAGEVLGRALRTRDNVKPVFVSAGNDITLDSAVRLTLACAGEESRIPVPTRVADKLTREMRAGLLKEYKI